MIRRGVLQPTDVFGTFSQINCPQEVINDPMYSPKLQGYRYYRGTIVFTLQVNASPFHVGYYRLVAIPIGGADTSLTNTVNWVSSHSYTFMQRSQLPHVPLDVATTSSVTLRVPFVSAYTSYPLTSVAGVPSTSLSLYNTAAVQIVPFAPLGIGAGGDLTVGYTLWAHIEDLDLSMPAVPQMGDLFPNSGSKMPSSNEAASKNIGPIQSTANVLSDVAGKLSTVPLLTNVAAPAKWALDIMAGVAGVFGWSKPTNLDVQRLVIRDAMMNTNFVNSSDNSRTLARMDQNIVEVLPGFSGTDVDEMSFDSFLVRPTIIQSFNWSSLFAVGTQLAFLNIHPASFSASSVTGVDTVVSHTPLSYMAKKFLLFRGDIRVTIKFVKTKMHSGRLLVSFVPAVEGVPNVLPTFDQTCFNHRNIYDIRDLDTISIIIPYHGLRPYRRTDQASADSLGTLQFFVLDELVAPTTTVQIISCIMSVSAEPHFEFAVPVNYKAIPYYDPVVVPTPQMGDMFADGPSTEVSYIGSSNQQIDLECEASRKCIGERITSLRQLVRVSEVFRPNPGFNAAITQNHIQVQPYVNPGKHALLPIPNLSVDTISQLCSMFTFSRGGVRWKVTVPNQTDSASDRIGRAWLSPIPYANLAQSIVEYVTVDTDGTAFARNASQGSKVEVVTAFDNRKGFEVAVPSYNSLPTRVNSSLTGKSTYLYTTTSIPPISVIFEVQASDTVFDYYRGGSDDFNLGQFISIPPFYEMVDGI